MDLLTYIKKKINKKNKKFFNYKIFFILFLLSSIFIIYSNNTKGDKEYTTQLYLLNYGNLYLLDQKYTDNDLIKLHYDFLTDLEQNKDKDSVINSQLTPNDTNYNTWKELLTKLSIEKNIKIKFERKQNAFSKSIYYILKFQINDKSNDLQIIKLNLEKNLNSINQNLNLNILSHIIVLNYSLDSALNLTEQNMDYFTKKNIVIADLEKERRKIMLRIDLINKTKELLLTNKIKHFHLTSFEENKNYAKFNITFVIGIYLFTFIIALIICLFKDVINIKKLKL